MNFSTISLHNKFYVYFKVIDGANWERVINLVWVMELITQEEAAAAGRGFANKDGLLGTGLKFEGEKYFVLNADDDRVIGKKGSQGFFIYKTGQGELN
ncbi:unnamed protein product [Strongylus vulgaris]|uniref:Profilin n=1 Tax=Strongylus vulgaris TaxID=40348 RepID=A0A3P7ISQ8_STRVU|nr:unnamed protein product [Strongylus vulgaris]